jgi:hypothetical protein
MIKNDKYDLLDGWLFWYDAEEDLWKAAEMEEFVKSLKKPKSLRVLAATSFDELLLFITEYPDIN